MLGNKINHLYIIGNGFDSGLHNLPTSYSDFRDYLKDRFPNAGLYYSAVPETTFHPVGGDEYITEEVVGYIIKILDSCGDGTWGELESFLGREIFERIKRYLENITGEYSLEKEGYAFYNNRYRTEDIRNSFARVKKFFYEWVMTCNSLFDCGINSLPNSKKSSIYFPEIASMLNAADSFLTFNYTLTLEKVYNISSDAICHIHGMVGSDFDDVYFGHGDSTTFDEMSEVIGARHNLQKLKDTLKKDTQQAYEKHMDFFNRITEELRDIHSFGFSMSDVDLFYIVKIAERIAPSKVTWYLNGYDDKRRREDSEGGRKLNGQIEKIKTMGFNIAVDDRW